MKYGRIFLVCSLLLSLGPFLRCSSKNTTNSTTDPGTWTGTKQLGVAAKSTDGRGAADPSGNVYVAGYTSGGLDDNVLTGTTDFFVTKYDSSGTKQWTKQLGVATKSTYGRAAATDSSDNVYVAGYTSGGLDGNVLTGINDLFITKYDSSGTKQWTKQLGVATKSAYGRAVTTDSSANIYVAGYTDGGLDGNVLTGTIDFFITKYDSAGTKQWTKQLGVATHSAYGNSVATDPSANIYVAGYTDGGLDSNALTGILDYFVTKYDSTGTKQWTKQLGVSAKSTYGQGLATDSSGNVFLAGYTYGALDGVSLSGTVDLFISKYDSSGTKQWTQLLGAASASTVGTGAVTDSSGNVLVVGYTDKGLDGNTVAGFDDVVVVKYDGSGTKQWTKQLGAATASTFGRAIAINSYGNVFVAGQTDKGLDGNTLTGTSDFFVTKYDSSGNKK